MLNLLCACITVWHAKKWYCRCWYCSAVDRDCGQPTFTLGQGWVNCTIDTVRCYHGGLLHSTSAAHFFPGTCDNGGRMWSVDPTWYGTCMYSKWRLWLCPERSSLPTITLPLEEPWAGLVASLYCKQLLKSVLYSIVNLGSSYSPIVAKHNCCSPLLLCHPNNVLQW